MQAEEWVMKNHYTDLVDLKNKGQWCFSKWAWPQIYQDVFENKLMHLYPSLGISYMDISSISTLLCFKHVLRNSNYLGSFSFFSSKSLLVNKCQMIKTKTDKWANSPFFIENDYRVEYIQRHNEFKFISQTGITGKKYKTISDRTGKSFA